MPWNREFVRDRPWLLCAMAVFGVGGFADSAWAQKIRLPHDPNNPTPQSCQAMRDEYWALVLDLAKQAGTYNKRAVGNDIEQMKRSRMRGEGMCTGSVVPECASLVDECTRVQEESHAANERCSVALKEIRERERQAEREQEKQRQAQEAQQRQLRDQELQQQGKSTLQRIERDQISRKQAGQNDMQRAFSAAIDKLGRGEGPLPPRNNSRSQSRVMLDDDDEDDAPTAAAVKPQPPVRIPVGPSPAQIAAERAAAEATARQAARLREQESLYETLTRQVAEARSTASTVAMLVKNPFEAAVGAVSDAGTARLMEGVGQATLPGYQPAGDARLERTREVVEYARQYGMAGNPFAAAVSGNSMQGVTAIEQRALSAMDQVSQSIAGFNADASTPTGSRPIQGSNVIRSVGEPSGTGTGSPAQNPFDDSKSATGRPPERYYDATSRQHFEIPANHVLYRSESGGSLSVVAANSVQANAGDRPGLGNAGCSRDGLGAVTPECEAKRKRSGNPFLK